MGTFFLLIHQWRFLLTPILLIVKSNTFGWAQQEAIALLIRNHACILRLFGGKL